jgi:hypothetical protein
VYVTPPSSPNYAPSLTLAEYYFDSDPGAGNGEYFYFDAARTVSLADLVWLGGTSAGQHTLFMRVRDSENRWSAPQLSQCWLCCKGLEIK